MKKWFLILFFFAHSIYANELCLKERFCLAEPGCYVVTEQSKSFTFFYIRHIQKERLQIEEVTIPAARFNTCRLSWRDWFQSGAPGHTSWIISQINLETGQFEETFSFTHQGWVDLSEGNSFLTTLLNLTFHQLPDKDRKHIGLPPAYGKQDKRPLWNPRLVVEGQAFSHVPFSVWKTRWPQDGSELSRKFIEIYLPETAPISNLPKFPTFFPYWIEIEGKIGSAKMRVVDSGVNARSPKPGLPLRSFEIVEENLQTPEGLTFQLKSPHYYQDFMVIAAPEDAFGKLIPLPCKVFAQEENVVLLIQKEALQTLSSGERYHFLISAKENPSICLETKKIYTQLDFINKIVPKKDLF